MVPGPARSRLWKGYGQRIVPEAGAAPLVFWNNDMGGKIALSEGGQGQFAIAREHGQVLVPIRSHRGR